MVGFTWPDGQPTQPEIGQLPQNVLVKFHDPRVGRISRVSVEDDAEAVPIEPVTAKFYGREGVTLHGVLLPPTCLPGLKSPQALRRIKSNAVLSLF